MVHGCLLLLLAVMLGLTDTSSLALWQWAIGRFLPSFIMMIMLLDCGVFIGTQGENYFGATTEKVDHQVFVKV